MPGRDVAHDGGVARGGGLLMRRGGPIVAIAGSTGLAPILSIVRRAVAMWLGAHTLLLLTCITQLQTR